MTNIRIAVANVNSEISFESSESPKDIKASIDKALASGGSLSLTDVKGREFLIPTEKIGFVEIGAPTERRVGFGK